MSVARILYFVVVLCSYVVMIYPCRRVAMNWFKLGPPTSKKELKEEFEKLK